MKFIAGYIWTQIQTTIHKFWVAYNMVHLYPSIKHVISWRDWFWRAIRHDWTKYKWDEASGFAQTIFDLKHAPYGSDTYKTLLNQIRPSIDLHYQRWDHHPEHWPNGWGDMSAIAKFELICDWTAAVRRHKGNQSVFDSIEKNADRFGYGYADKVLLRACAEILT